MLILYTGLTSGAGLIAGKDVICTCSPGSILDCSKFRASGIEIKFQQLAFSFGNLGYEMLYVFGK